MPIRVTATDQLYLAIAFHEVTVILRVRIAQKIEVGIELSNEAAAAYQHPGISM